METALQAKGLEGAKAGAAVCWFHIVQEHRLIRWPSLLLSGWVLGTFYAHCPSGKLIDLLNPRLQRKKASI